MGSAEIAYQMQLCNEKIRECETNIDRVTIEISDVEAILDCPAPV